mmetsp:Transcript_22421/g.33566  ORF Transcript_22421/g.33566 Transcript_22421/m.33566 type:complete len:222 (+) Transcript_22421:97-762(+)|eukprot:CAMPEP_0206450832 /NCGR_PEP_ID=MMETSP0324_2-20121206/18970_1 /ASSEMBLY_ACC=CAM_ASM_000836 /TAXON_ID=2866 /ORGANISM="Crypthecodinium cohnii, Strain Seligo" /LENGTH=221 /DNA_ID=CAMNT_0053920577 /DNA_START=36 /DNA_END=701 /DNA_ORIENTATION=+
MAPKSKGTIDGRSQQRTTLHSKLFGPSPAKRARPSVLDQPASKAKAKAKSVGKAATVKTLSQRAFPGLVVADSGAAGVKLRQLLLRRGLSSEAASLLVVSLLPMPPARQRGVLTALGRLSELVAKANDDARIGSLCATAILQEIDDEVQKRQAELLKQSREAHPFSGDDEIKLECPECDSSSATGTMFNSAAGSKPMLGRARIVTRGSCSQCGHVWIADEG